MLIAGLAGVAIAVAGGFYIVRHGTESTDDAQVEGRVMNVSARVPGQVAKVLIEDNQKVNAGDVLVELDPADYATRVESARADLGAAKASEEGARATLALTEKTAPANAVSARGGLAAAASNVNAARAATDQARADVDAASSRLTLATINFERSKRLFADGAVPNADVDTRRTDFDNATAQLQQARARLTSAEAEVIGSGGSVTLAKGKLDAATTSTEQVATARAALTLASAKVLQAESALHLAELNLSYTTIRAPRGGIVSRRTVEAGQMVNPERPLFAIVPTDDVWIVANFKEDQLAEMVAGQKASVQLDTYGSKAFRGHVESIAGGTGARFALLPPDNATGNFVKVVQRIPVLVRLDPNSGVELRPGMSADVTVSTR